MSEEFPTGKILVHTALYGLPIGPDKRTFWSKTYGKPAVHVGDTVEISFNCQLGDELVAYGEEWTIASIRQCDGPYRNEHIVYWERD